MPIAPIPLAAMLRRYTRGNFLLIPILPTVAITYSSNAHCDNTPWPQCSATTRVANFLLVPILLTAAATYSSNAHCANTSGHNALPLHARQFFCLYQYYLQQQLFTAAIPIATTPLAEMLCHHTCGQFFAYTNITYSSNAHCDTTHGCNALPQHTWPIFCLYQYYWQEHIFHGILII